jgi:tellurite resistance protein TerC
MQPSIGSPFMWIGFLAIVLAMLALDLGVFHRHAHAVRPREALCWTLVWVALALAFNVFVWQHNGKQAGIEFLTGYLIEKSLSVDNIFVFVVIFRSLAVPLELQHRVLFWGILSALFLRAAMILAGATLIARFHWLMYVFGAFLVFTGIRLFLERGKVEPEASRVMNVVRRAIPTTERLDGPRFFTRENGRRMATPLFLTLILIEISDVIFAVDSIPAIFAVTTDPYIVFTSNIFAILGLRSLFFLLANAVVKFHYLKVGLSAVLVFVGCKMLIAGVYKVPSPVSLAVIATLLAASILASLLRARRLARHVFPCLRH